MWYENPIYIAVAIVATCALYYVISNTYIQVKYYIHLLSMRPDGTFKKECEINEQIRKKIEVRNKTLLIKNK